MTTALGRTQVSYIIRCALPAGTAIIKEDQDGNSYTFRGLLGVAPQWQNGACDATCAETVSACLLAHVNTAGQHVPIWVVSNNPSVGWGQDPDYPNHEGTFFGNVFQLGAHGTDPAKAPMFYCTGPQYRTSPPPGRLGNQAEVPYVNPWGPNAACVKRCTPADYPFQSDGYKACNGWNNTFSVWRRGATSPAPTGGTINTTANSVNGKLTIPSPRGTSWGVGHGFRDMED